MSHCLCPSCGAELTITTGLRPSQQQQQRPARGTPGNAPPQPMDAERARAFRMPFGKHKDLTLGEIARIDPEYIAWGAVNFDRSLGRACTFMAGLIAAAPPADRLAETEDAMASGAY